MGFNSGFKGLNILLIYMKYKHECLFIHLIHPHSKDEMGWAYDMYGKQENCIESFVGETSVKKTTWKIKHRWEDDVKMDLQ